jgi:isochorismate hydrolase
MKEQYLSPVTLDQVIDEMVIELTGRYYRPKPYKLMPERSALLVLDMQNYFLDPASHAFTPSAPAILPNIKTLTRMAGQNQMPLIFTRHVNDSYNAGRMNQWWREMIVEGTFESEIYMDAAQADCKVIVKNQYDAFYHTDLEDYLHAKNIGQVIITGVLTNLCCETTARSAFVRGFEVFFPVDATAAYNREFHLSTFRNLGFGFCPVLKTSDLIKSLDHAE